MNVHDYLKNAQYFLISCALFLCISNDAFCQEDSSKVRPAYITKLSQVKLPPPMVASIKSMTKDNIYSLQEEYQENIREDGEEFVITIKLRFMDDHIIGYIKKAPLRQSNRVEISKTVIDIPVEWCGTIDSTKTKHCVKSLEELEAFTKEVKTSNWRQKDEAEELAKSKPETSFGKPDLSGKKKKKGSKDEDVKKGDAPKSDEEKKKNKDEQKEEKQKKEKPAKKSKKSIKEMYGEEEVKTDSIPPTKG
ncbi:MAG: hypothetical protein ACOVNY_02870 [Chitinophagaceae bacterium]